MKRAGLARSFRLAGATDQRFENWNERRALARPYFLRSTTRGSRRHGPACRASGYISAPRASRASALKADRATAWFRPWSRAPGVLAVHDRDVEGLGLLRHMRVIGPGIDP